LTALRSVTVDKKLWFEGIFLAVAAKAIAKELKKDRTYSDEVFIASMMQSYGVFVLSHFYPDSYPEFRSISNYQERIEKEREAFEMSHLDISATVLLDWGLPQKITEIIANQAAYTDKSTEEQNIIIELARFLLGMESKGDEEIKYLLQSNASLQASLNKYKIDLTINLEFINKLFDETKDLVTI
jgi:HD-like signal output (HDOD) protein